MAPAYYNENDPFCARWLRNLIAAGHIAPGEVDERDIRDVKPNDLAPYGQCHFFAGIRGWSYALRLAGWPDGESVWTGSCPCQPFSAAGARVGFADERHLWPEFFRLIRERRPVVVLGEQVASALAWFDAVSGDLEGENYAVGAAIVGAHSVGAPHIRQRLYFVAHRPRDRRREERALVRGSVEGDGAQGLAAGSMPSGPDRELAFPDGRHSGSEGLQRSGEHGQRQADGGARDGTRGGIGKSEARELADRELPGLEIEREQQARGECQAAERSGAVDELGYPRESGSRRDAGAVSRAQAGIERSVRGESHELEPAGFWSECEWLPCRDGKFRPVKPGIFPLASGIPGRVGRLRAYGNAIVPPVAAEFVKACLAVVGRVP